MRIEIPKGVKWVIGIDEVGRGPLAGPVCLCGVRVSVEDFKKFPKKFRDSKKLSEKERQRLCNDLCGMKGAQCEAAYAHAKSIDKKGIEKSIRDAIKNILKRHNVKADQTLCLLDGRLHAPDGFHQETIIKGDEKVPLISAASIYAKVRRDEYMKRKSQEFPEYGFETHVGYGTKIHIEAIRKKGICKLHRISYCKNV